MPMTMKRAGRVLRLATLSITHRRYQQVQTADRKQPS